MNKISSTLSQKKQKKAFALVMSLFLMGFLVLLVITLSSIVQMELRSTKQHILDQRAKQAAKLAAYQALAEIQKSLGADQRISANASILDTQLNDVFDALEEDPSYSFWLYDPMFSRDEVNSIDSISNPHWLGVWDSTPGMHPLMRDRAESKAEHSERVLYYATNFLVSGNKSIKRENVIPQDVLQLAYSPTDELSDNYINMLRKNSISDENGNYDPDTMRVKVPLVSVTPTQEAAKRAFLETRIAWWVSDESQKAPINIIASEDDFNLMTEDESKKTLIQSMPFKNGIQALSLPDSDSAIFDIDLNSEEGRNQIRKLHDLSQLDLLSNSMPSNASAAKFLYNSLTISSNALAVNIRNGGLKKDLSVGLIARNPESLDSEPNYFERPVGVVGYDAYLSNTLDSNTGKTTPNIFEQNSAYKDGKGHMFGPQDPANINLSYVGLNYSLNSSDSNDTADAHKDTGGPLWDSLREYYNNRVDKDGLDAYKGNTEGSYANKIKTKTDVSTGLSPVLMHYQLFTYPTLSDYGDDKYGVRVYFIPLVVLWNPYDIDIEAGSTFAFRHGMGSPDAVGTFRIAIGIRNSSTNRFEAIRDIRSETMPRPMPTLAEKNSYYTYKDGSNVSGANYSFSGSDDINAYRAVSWLDNDERILVISASTDGVNDTTKVQSGDHDYISYPINKSYFGYGDFRYEDTKNLVSGVEDAQDANGNYYFPQGTTANGGVDSIKNAGLVRIYEKGDVSSLDITLTSQDENTQAETITVDLPPYYYLSSESFYYRKLYFNNLLYSLGYTGQITLSQKGSLSSLTEDEMRTAYFEGSGGSDGESTGGVSYLDEALRFLVKTQETLKAGEAKIFTLKGSVPYHYTYNKKEGYAGNFARAVENAWYLTEGVDPEAIGGFFVDVMHPERTYLASASANNYNGDAANRPSYEINNYKNMIFDPMEECPYDNMKLGVLFDLSNGRNYTYVDESGQSKSVSIDDISLDFDKWSVDLIDIINDRRLFLPPLGYLKAESAFIPDPWRSVSSSLMKNHGTGLLNSKVYDENGYNFALRRSELLMWNYNDDNDDIALYKDEYSDEDMASYIHSGFQSLKRYALPKAINSPIVEMQSFPEPTRIYDDYQSGSGNYFSYFTTKAGMSSFPNINSSNLDDQADATAKSYYENPSAVEQTMFLSKEQGTPSTSSYGMNVNYTSGAPASTASLIGGDIRDKVRGRNVPTYAYSDSYDSSCYYDASTDSNGYTIFDGYYRNIMAEVNASILEKGGSEDDCFYDGISDEENVKDYKDFLELLGLDEKYKNKSWVWEDPYFLLRNPRRVAHPFWDLDPSDSDNQTTANLLWKDNLPQSFTVQSQQRVKVSDFEDESKNLAKALTLDAITANNGKSLVFYEGISAYKPVSKEMESTGSNADQFFFQYPFKFPWLNQSNATAKVYGDGFFGNGGAFRDRNYGTETSRGEASGDNLNFFSTGAMANNFQYSGYQVVGEEGTEGNFRMDEWFSFYIDRFADDSDGAVQVQIGADVLSTEGYKYTLKRFLRHYESVSNLVDLSTANLAFGADQNRSLSIGTATADMYYPNNLIGSSYAPLRISPERYFDYLWADGFISVTTNSQNIFKGVGDGVKASTEIRQVTYDIAWHLNDLLWDEYFFSSIPYRSAEQNALDEYYEYLIPRNPRIEYVNASKDKFYARVNIASQDEEVYSIDNKVKSDEYLDYDFDINSARFWIKGAFNVNSTNVDAWKMVLATSFGNGIYGLDGSYVEVNDKAAFPRNAMPYTAQEFTSENVRYNEKLAMQGFRALDRIELEELALSIVENIKDRGPFFSLAQFVNRAVELRSAESIRMASDEGFSIYDFSNEYWAAPLSATDVESIQNSVSDEMDLSSYILRQDHMQKGVLQSAIDLTSINQAFFNEAYLVDYDDEDGTAALNSKYTSIDANNEHSLAYATWGKTRSLSPNLQEVFWLKFGNPRNVWENYRATLGSTLAGAPTYLTQVDILKQIGSFITLRGDTFKIRAYGEVRNPITEEVESKAWCEMLVQRYPEYIDASSNTPTDINNREKELGDQGAKSEYDSLLQHLEDSPVNKYLGRRFKVVSFRWLSEREI